jgi:hypothetical protein
MIAPQAGARSRRAETQVRPGKLWFLNGGEITLYLHKNQVVTLIHLTSWGKMTMQKSRKGITMGLAGKSGGRLIN